MHDLSVNHEGNLKDHVGADIFCRANRHMGCSQSHGPLLALDYITAKIHGMWALKPYYLGPWTLTV